MYGLMGYCFKGTWDIYMNMMFYFIALCSEFNALMNCSK